ncbi:MAG: 50S ribosomal protein L25 [Candidatus Levybacteria bacterium]|nr:50S ribosomal protein L25 [Candidatus Levybacteria bacterium]
MKRTKLAVEKRTIIGKKVRKLRKEGLLPANVYGKKIKSFSVQVNQKTFEALFKDVGQTGLIDLEIDGKTHPVLVKNIQFSYPDRTPIHVDFYQVDLTEKVKAMVPLVIAGEAKAVADNTGILLQQISEVEVEALPEKLPENISVNVEKLSAVDEQITVADLKAAEGVAILTDKELVVVKIGELVTKEAQAEAEAQAAAAAQQQAAKAEGAEAPTAPEAEGAKPEEEKPQETAQPEPQEKKA